MRRLVAFVVIAAGTLILAGLSLVLVGRSRASAERARCQDNLRRIGSHFLFEEAQAAKTYPAGTVVADLTLQPDQRLSWVVPGLSRLGHANLSKQVDLSRSWSDAANKSVAETFLAVLICPSTEEAQHSPGPAFLKYPGIAGVGTQAAWSSPDATGAGMFRYDSGTKLSDVKDGLSHTLMLIESADRPGPWIAGGPATIRPLDPATQPYLGRGQPFGGFHVGGANVAFADGSGRFFADHVSSEVLERLAGIADGDKPILSNP
jgi:prepilin-type processing-associated H-X9-DG protein